LPYFYFWFIQSTDPKTVQDVLLVTMITPNLKWIWPSTAKLYYSCCWYFVCPCDLHLWPFTLDSVHAERVMW